MFLKEIGGGWGISFEGKKGMSTKENLKIVQLKDVYLLHLSLLFSSLNISIIFIYQELQLKSLHELKY